MIFYYIRHGDPIYNPDSLTELGHKQAAALAKRLSLYGLDEIYCSTSMRARMTADYTCKALGLTPTLLDWTNEKYAFSELSVLREDGRRSWAYYLDEYRAKMTSPQARAAGMDWHKLPDFKDTTFTAGMERIHRETDAFFRSLGFEHDRQNACYKRIAESEKRIALFAHEGFGKAFLSSILDLPYPFVATRYELSHTSVTVIFFDEKKERIFPRVLQWANDSHLYKENLLTGYSNWIDV